MSYRDADASTLPSSNLNDNFQNNNIIIRNIKAKRNFKFTLGIAFTTVIVSLFVASRSQTRVISSAIKDRSSSVNSPSCRGLALKFEWYGDQVVIGRIEPIRLENSK